MTLKNHDTLVLLLITILSMRDTIHVGAISIESVNESVFVKPWYVASWFGRFFDTDSESVAEP